ncbi:MAG TPA: HAMP domain-containing protein, partial [Desulfobulbaceae bacterium]|nr:HAMP domain-containing protein [Desulfobulbaceae bacterium]
MQRILLVLQPETIRHRLMLLSAITIGMAVVLIAMNSYQVISLENDLLTMEKVDGLMNNILELRRYEKNILLKIEKGSVQKAMQTLYLINKDIKALEPQLVKGAAAASFTSLVSNFNSYKNVFKRWCALNLCPDSAQGKRDIVRIRQYGRNMVDDGEELVRHIRESLRVKFKKIMFGLTVVSILIFSCGAAITYSQTKNILRRLVSLRQATRDLAAGKFTPIHVPRVHDETTNLIVSFNKMVEALEQKQEQLIQSKKMASIG